MRVLALARSTLCLVAVHMASPAMAQLSDEELPILPTVRYGSPEKLAVGFAVQRDLPWFGPNLIGSLTAGTGGAKLGVGIGKFGGSLMVGLALQATALRTYRHPTGARPGQTFVGFEGECMMFALSVKVGPAMRVAGPPGDGRFALNWSVGWGF